MIIALDVDGTYTADMVLFDDFINKANERGHLIVIATMRHQHEAEGLVSHFGDRVHMVIATGRKAKRPFLHALGIFPAIWIDDEPAWIDAHAEGHEHTPEGGFQ